MNLHLASALASLPAVVLGFQNLLYGLLWLLLAPIAATIADVARAHILRLLPSDEAEP